MKNIVRLYDDGATLVCKYKGEEVEVRIDPKFITDIATVPGTWFVGPFNRSQRTRRKDFNDPTAFYCYTRITVDGVQYTVLLHRFVVVAATRDASSVDGKIVDHINGHETDNRLSNLQATSQQANIAKQRMSSTPRSYNKLGVRNVSQRPNGKYEVSVARKYWGIYNTLAEADHVATGIRHRLNTQRTGRA